MTRSNAFDRQTQSSYYAIMQFNNTSYSLHLPGSWQSSTLFLVAQAVTERQTLTVDRMTEH